MLEPRAPSTNRRSLRVGSAPAQRRPQQAHSSASSWRSLALTGRSGPRGLRLRGTQASKSAGGTREARRTGQAGAGRRGRGARCVEGARLCRGRAA
eukprot:3657470-Rhodomonas_salina.1